MLRTIIMALVLLGSSWAQASAPRLADQAREITLKNGMRVVLVKRGQAPKIAAGWVAHVGSANERPGITGISHLFEHMMFKGTPTIGAKDPELDAQIRKQLDDIRAKMFRIERSFRDKVRRGLAESLTDPALETPEYKALKKQFAELVQKQRDNMVKDEFDKIYTEAGASGMNAFTNQDMTVYFIQVPKNKLELWFWMESERLLHPVFREFYSERDVVYEERRMRTESTPTGVQDEVFESLFWRGHPYGWPVVGWPSDIASITRQQAEAYYDQYYAANNLTAVIVGDFDEQQAEQLAEKYFGRLHGNAQPPEDVVTLRTPQNGEVVYEAEVDDNASATLAYHTTAFDGADDPALGVLASILSGRTGRLYKALQLEQKLATQTWASADGRKYDGVFEVYAQGGAETAPETLRDALLAVIEDIKKNGVTEEEIQRVRNQRAAGKYRGLKDPFRLMITLLYVDGLRDWKVIDKRYEKINKVSPADVQAVARKYLTPDNLAVKLYRRKAGAQDDPDFAALAGDQKAQARQMWTQIKQLPKEKLPEVLGKLQAARGQAPEAMQPVIDVLIKKMQARTQEH
jgi:predicted Zn-dependent peptidase